MSNTYKETRLRWEKEQEGLHGCCYVNVTCMVHGGAQPEKKKEQELPKTVELPLLCTYRSFNHPHLLGAHNELDCDYDWRTPGGASAKPATLITTPGARVESANEAYQSTC